MTQTETNEISKWELQYTVRVVQLQVNSRTTRVTGLGWNIGFSLCAAPFGTEFPFVDESTEWELLSLLGDWYEPESIESLFPSMPSDVVFFSS